MPAEIETMFSVNAVPWHQIGRVLNSPPTMEEGIIAAGLDWAVSLDDLFYKTQPESRSILDSIFFEPVPGKKLVIRKPGDHPLGVVSDSYVPVQNRDMFQFFNPVLESGEGTLETAGSLFDGKRVWVMVKLNGEQEIVDGDLIKPYCLLASSHDGSLAVTIKFTAVRVVCNNTLQYAFSSGGDKLSVLHKGRPLEAMKKIQEIMDFQRGQFKLSLDTWRELTKFSIPEKELDHYFEECIFGSKRKDVKSSVIPKVRELYNNGSGMDIPLVRGTAWAAVNAITEYIQHKRGKSAQRRFNSSMFGNGNVIANKAVKKALEYA